MDKQSFIQIFDIKGTERCQLEERWETLTADWNDQKLPFFLDEEYFTKLFPFLKVTNPLEEVLPSVKEVIRIASEHKEVALLGHILSKAAFDERKPLYFPFPEGNIPFLGEKYSGPFAVMASMSIYPYLVKAHAELGIPEKYAQDILAWIGGTTIAYEQAHPGIFGRSLVFSWLERYVSKTLFRIGRLEYLIHPAPEWLCAIYANDEGDLKVLCRDKWNIQPDRKRRASEEEETLFTTFFHETADTVTGIVCPPDGEIDGENIVTLNKKEYHSVLTPWDVCPSIHIPAGGRMPFEEVLSSMKEAAVFFQKYFKRHVPLICCSSWILNPAWEDLLSSSNMARFRQECYAQPCVSWGNKAGMGFIFGRTDVPPTEIQAKNSLQKVFQEAYSKKLLGAGGIFVLTKDLDKLGDQYYRKKFGVQKQK